MTHVTPDEPWASEHSPCLAKLNREHREGLVLAEEIARIAETGDDDAVAQAVARVRDYNTRELEAHLQQEEQTILGPLVQEQPAHRDLCIRLGREHGYIRSLVEALEQGSARQNLAAFARVLTDHTLIEETQLMPLVESLFSQEQRDRIAAFAPLRPVLPDPAPTRAAPDRPPQDRVQEWAEPLAAHLRGLGPHGGGIVLLARYQPEAVQSMAAQLGLRFFDFQQEVMRDLGTQAEAIDFAALDAYLTAAARQGGIMCHNIEALLCVRTDDERRTWLRHFTATPWPHPVLLPLTLYQADAPESEVHVCDLELVTIPRTTTAAQPVSDHRAKYRID